MGTGRRYSRMRLEAGRGSSGASDGDSTLYQWEPQCGVPSQSGTSLWLLIRVEVIESHRTKQQISTSVEIILLAPIAAVFSSGCAIENGTELGPRIKHTAST